MANIVGTSGNDTLNGTPDSDSINGLAGNDTLDGQAGNDTVVGGVGNDMLYGGLGNDALNGGTGDDYLYGGTGGNSGAGNDTYTFAVGTGVDHINDYDTTVGNIDVATFTGVASTAVTALERQGNGLVLKSGASDQVIVDSYFSAFFPDYKVEQFKFSNGVTWDEAAIKARVITVGTTIGDSITGYNDGTNRIYGFDGNDSLTGGALTDLIDGGTGNDTLNGQAGNDTLLGGLGADTLLGGLGNDVLNGGTGDDYLYGGTGSNSGAGNDTYTFAVGSGVDHINDYDTTVGNTDVATFTGVASTGVTAVERQGNGLVLKSGASDQVIVDSYFSAFFPDYKVEQFKFSNGVTWDEAAIKARVITVGTTIGDSITGYNDGTNRIYGFDGNDSLTGGALTDLIDGGTGNDTLNGQAGNDTLLGGLGADSLNGGLGNDTFDYNSVSESPVGTGRDVIIGFAGAGAAIGDKIDLTTIDANSLAAGNQAFIWGGAFTAGHLRYVGGVLQGNTDADAAAEFEIQLVGTPALVVGGAGTDILL